MDDASAATNTPYLRDKKVQPKVISARTGSRNDAMSRGIIGSMANSRPANSPTEAVAVAGLPAVFCRRETVCGTLRHRSMLNTPSPRFPPAKRRTMRVSADFRLRFGDMVTVMVLSPDRQLRELAVEGERASW